MDSRRSTLQFVLAALLFQERLGLTKVLLFLAALFGLILATGIEWNRIDTGSILGVAQQYRPPLCSLLNPD
jgi:hypothetical protein